MNSQVDATISVEELLCKESITLARSTPFTFQTLHPRYDPRMHGRKLSNTETVALQKVESVLFMSENPTFYKRPG